MAFQACRPDCGAVDFLACGLQPSGGPLAVDHDRTVRRQRPDEVGVVPRSASASTAALTDHRPDRRWRILALRPVAVIARHRRVRMMSVFADCAAVAEPDTDLNSCGTVGLAVWTWEAQLPHR